MMLWLIRLFLVVSSGAIGGYLARVLQSSQDAGSSDAIWYGIFIGASSALLVVALEWVLAKRQASLIPTLVVGLLLGFLVAPQLAQPLLLIDAIRRIDERTGMVQAFVIYLFTFLATMVIYRTRNEFKFSFPYVQFRKEGGNVRPLILDTSSVIDGRILDICRTRILDGPLLVPRFVLRELQGIADSSDKLKRNRGRRGLDVLQGLQQVEGLEVKIDESSIDGIPEVDGKLVALAKSCHGRIVTHDFNLNKVAKLDGVEVINLNDLARALRPAVLPGETLQIKLLRGGEEPDQGVGYLEDGTMVVVESGKPAIGKTVPITVTSAIQTSAGRMVFGKLS
jgi:uncharacterized protein YacL